MKAQEIFDTVVTHLRKQGCCAESAVGHCMYRAPNGLKCAAGCLITDNEYSLAMEGKPFFKIAPPRLKEHTNLICDLQSVHDSIEIQNWENRFAYIAANHYLKYTK
jgi:hypothetical protein